MATFYIKQNDLAPPLQYQLLGANGLPQSLQGSPSPVVQFRMYDRRPVWPLTGPTAAVVTNNPSLPGGAYILGYTFILTIGGLESPQSGPTGVLNVGAGQAISLATLPLPTWASAVKWYILAGPPNTTGFVVQNNGSAFVLSSVGNGIMPPFVTAQEIQLVQADTTNHVTIDDPNNGLVSYHWQTGDTATSGTYYADFTNTPSGGQPESFPNNDMLLISIAPR